MNTNSKLPEGFDPLLRADVVALMLGISKQGLWNMCWLGRFPRPLKLGGRWSAWRQSTVENWIKAREEAAAQPTVAA